MSSKLRKLETIQLGILRNPVPCQLPNQHPPILRTNAVRGHEGFLIYRRQSSPPRSLQNQFNVASAAEACPSTAVSEWRCCLVEVTMSAGKHTMASSSSLIQDGGPDHIIRPRPVKPSNPMVLRAQSGEGSLKPNGHIDTVMSGTSR